MNLQECRNRLGGFVRLAVLGALLAAFLPLRGAVAQEGITGEEKKIKIVWKEHATKHYDIAYEAVIPASTVEFVGRELEDILVQYRAIFKAKPSARFKVKFLDSMNTYEQEGGDPSHPGFYVERPEGKFLVIRQMPFYQLIPTVYHEAMHQYLADWLGEGVSIPTWFTEGMAMFYEGMQREERGAKKLNPKKINKRRLRMVQDAMVTRQLVGVTDLVDATHEQFHDKDKESLYYAESFSLIYFFILSKGTKSVLKYMKELKETKEVEQANVKLFGKDRKNLAKIEKKWKRYILNVDPEAD